MLASHAYKHTRAHTMRRSQASWARARARSHAPNWCGQATAADDDDKRRPTEWTLKSFRPFMYCHERAPRSRMCVMYATRARVCMYEFVWVNARGSKQEQQPANRAVTCTWRVQHTSTLAHAYMANRALMKNDGLGLRGVQFHPSFFCSLPPPAQPQQQYTFVHTHAAHTHTQSHTVTHIHSIHVHSYVPQERRRSAAAAAAVWLALHDWHASVYLPSKRVRRVCVPRWRDSTNCEWYRDRRSVFFYDNKIDNNREKRFFPLQLHVHSQNTSVQFHDSGLLIYLRCITANAANPFNTTLRSFCMWTRSIKTSADIKTIFAREE